MPSAFTSAQPAGLIGTPSDEKFTGVISGAASAAAAGGEAGSGASAGSLATAAAVGSGAAGAGRSSQRATAPAASSAAGATRERYWCGLEESNQVLVTVQVTVWVERGHEVA